jgi:hypothetical protein
MADLSQFGGALNCGKELRRRTAPAARTVTKDAGLLAASLQRGEAHGATFHSRRAAVGGVRQRERAAAF